MFKVLLLALAVAGSATVVSIEDALSAEREVRSFHYRPAGTQLRRLPRGHARVVVGSTPFHYFDGVFYRPAGRGFVVVGAPLGARVGSIPRTYVSFGIGSRHYFFVNSTYYLWEPRTREYVVVEEPEGAPDAMTAGSQTDRGPLFAYPNDGQSEESARRDRYECHLWAAEQSGYDPTYSGQLVELADDYRRAMTACLVGRGYSVQ
jgi:hypothetical protein